MTSIRIATRGSDLALVQARYVAGRIEAELGTETELVAIKTTGDRIQNVLQADDFASDVYRKLNVHLEIVRDEMQHIVSGEDPDASDGARISGNLRRRG